MRALDARPCTSRNGTAPVSPSVRSRCKSTVLYVRQRHAGYPAAVARWMRLTAAAATGYLLGTTPSADIAARLATAGTTDLHASGSGNPGAYNAIKVLGPAWGYGVMAADIGKGMLAGSLGRGLAGATGANL